MKQKIKYNTDIYYKEFKEYIDNTKEYLYYEGLKDKIKNEYIKKIKNQKIDIEIEKIRLKSLIANVKSPLRSESMNVVMVSISILASAFINAIASLYKNIYVTIIFASLCTFTIMIPYFKTFKREPSKLFLYNICLEILEELKQKYK